MKTNLQTNLTAGGSASNSSAAAKFLSLRQLCARHLKMAINFIMPFLLCSVMSFNATAQDYSITTTGNAIVLTDISGNGDTLFVSQSGTNMRFLVKPTSRTYSVDGGPVTAFSTPAGAALAGVADITVNANAGNDSIIVGSFTANLPNLTINGGTGDDAVNFNGNINFAANASLDVDMQNDDAAPGIDNVAFASSAQLILLGTGTAIIKVSKNVNLQFNNILRTANGDLTVEANQQTIPSSGNFIGVNLATNCIIEATGTGIVAVRGKGGNTLAGNYGVSVFAAKISGGTAGTLIVNGTGGASTDQLNYGVVISSTNSIITSSGGNVSVTGLGGGSGASNSNVGVYASRGNVTAGGSGTVSVRGTGGLGTGVNNYGIAIESGTITSTSGNVSVTGQGGSSGSAAGIAVSSSGRITAGNNASVTVHGAGGPSSGYGVWLAINGTITSSGGNVNVTGQGNGNNGNSWGISLQGSGVISAGGSGIVTVFGTGSLAGSGNYGLVVSGSGSLINSSGGDVNVTGQGGGTGASSLNIGISIQFEGTITAGGSGTLTVLGTGAVSTGTNNHGIYLGSKFKNHFCRW